ncbi:MAG: hypothetical protein J7605_25215 [Variovorax sp.]|nr:hypothetical protein [Variovorax sp.]
MTRLARALMVAAVAGGVTMTSLAFNGTQGGGGGGARGGMRGGGAHAVGLMPARNAFFVHPGFPGRPVFVAHPGFPHRRFIVAGGPVFFGPPPVVFVSGVPALWYCQNPIGYFPTIQACPVGWIEMTQ